MATVDLVYDPGCPNVGEARAHLQEAFANAGLTPRWSEHVIGGSGPAHARGYGSPTILIDGRDVSGASPGDEASCRLYRDERGGLARVPTVAQIATTLSRAHGRVAGGTVGGWRSGLAVLPGIGAALLPKVACPACWPAYAGLLTSLGLGFLLDGAWLLPLTAAFLMVAVGALAFRARGRRGYRPFGLGVIASGLVLLGKFAFESDAAMFGGIGLLVGASLWNSWPRRRAACPACVTPT